MFDNLAMGGRRLRAAVIGCGWIGAGESPNREDVGIQSHAQAYTTHARTSLTAVVDASADVAERSAVRWNAGQAFTDSVKMVQTVDPEIVSICTPDALHASTILTVLGSSRSLRAILAEKPLALTPGEAREVKAAADARGVILGVNYSRRYCPAYAELRAEIESGVFGKIQQVHGYYGKGLVHNGTHWIDLLRYLCGEISHIRALPLPVIHEDTPAISILLRNGASAILQPSNPEAFTLFEMDILAEKGRIRMLSGGLFMERYTVGPSPYFTGYTELLSSGRKDACMSDAIIYAINNMINCIDSPACYPACAANDAIIALELAAEAVEQFQKFRLNQ
ncbi:MAG: Gfo/Idh/MocA family oxidoreductase [Verrucomicrobiota bacterium]